MPRSFVVVCLLTIVGVALGTCSAHAQLRVQVTNAPPNEAVEVMISGDDVSDTGTATSSAGGTLSMLLNAANLGKVQPTELAVYIEDCEDGATVRLVAAGGDTPEDCDEGCNCRRGGAVLLLEDTTWVSVDFSTGAATAGNNTQDAFNLLDESYVLRRSGSHFWVGGSYGQLSKRSRAEMANSSWD